MNKGEKTAAPESARPEETAGLPQKADADNKEKWTLRYRLTQEEIVFCLKNGTRRRMGKGGLMVETVLLSALALYCLIAYVGEAFQQPSSLFFGVAALFLIAVIWIVPDRRFRSEAARLSEEAAPVHLTVYEDGLLFSGDEERYPFEGLTCRQTPEMLLLLFGMQIVGIPKRAADGDCWRFLCEKLTETP